MSGARRWPLLRRPRLITFEVEMHGEIDVEERADLQFASWWMPPLLIDKLAERHIPSPIGNQIPIIRGLLTPYPRMPL